MDPDVEEAEVFSEPEEPLKSEEEDEDEEEEDAKIFDAWMRQYRAGRKDEEKKDEEGDADGVRTESSSGLGIPAGMLSHRRSSLPCPATLSAMQLTRLHSSTEAPVTVRVLIRRSSSRRLPPSPQESTPPPVPTPPAIPTIPESTGRRNHFRRRNVLSLSDADSVCLICHNALNQGPDGSTELQCAHTFHRECIAEWLWRKESCPTCHVHVSAPQHLY